MVVVYPLCTRPPRSLCLWACTGHHSTSDDSTRYRSADEIEHWRSIDPISRMRHYLVAKEWWSEEEDKSFNKKIRKGVLKALNTVRAPLKPLAVSALPRPLPRLTVAPRPHALVSLVLCCVVLVGPG